MFRRQVLKVLPGQRWVHIPLEIDRAQRLIGEATEKLAQIVVDIKIIVNTMVTAQRLSQVKLPDDSRLTGFLTQGSHVDSHTC